MTNLGIEKSVKSLSLAVTEFVCKLFAAAKKNRFDTKATQNVSIRKEGVDRFNKSY